MEFNIQLENENLIEMLQIVERAAEQDPQAKKFLDEAILYIAVEGVVCHTSISTEFEISVWDILYNKDNLEECISNEFDDYVLNNTELESVYMELDKR